MAIKTPKAPRPPQPPAQPRGMGRRAKTAIAETKSALRKFGPRYLKLYALPRQEPDFCTPWPTFVGAHTSLSEQMIYAALCIKLDVPGNWREPPYDGRGFFSYQDPLLGGRLTKGGQVCDFLVPWGTEEVCFRLQSEYWHLMAAVEKRIDEFVEKIRSFTRIVDIYEPEFVGDCSGEAAVRTVARALAGREIADPVATGTVQPTRRRGGER